MSRHDEDFIPSNPVVDSRSINESTIINSTQSVRERSGEKVVIPAWPPKPVKVEVPPPVQRRHFVDPNARGGRPVRKD